MMAALKSRATFAIKEQLTPPLLLPIAIACLALLATYAVSHATQPSNFDFDDGTAQGWTVNAAGHLLVSGPGFGGSAYALNIYQDHPGDDVLVKAPSSFSGDLSRFSGIRWDEFMPDYDADNYIGTGLYLVGTDGSFYAFAPRPPLLEAGQWQVRSLNFDPTNYFQWSGFSSFDTVLHNVQALYISGITSSLGTPGLQVSVDNITLVPEPTALQFTLLTILWAFLRAGRRLVPTSPTA
jgi:hypothetical protein